MPTSKEIIGKGMIFPLELTTEGRVVITDGIDLINASLKTILAWPYGFRFFLNEFGTKIYTALEEPNDDILKTQVFMHLAKAITIWETRIKQLDEVEFDRNDDRTNMRIRYTLKKDNLTGVLTFPFYTKLPY